MSSCPGWRVTENCGSCQWVETRGSKQQGDVEGWPTTKLAFEGDVGLPMVAGSAVSYPPRRLATYALGARLSARP